MKILILSPWFPNRVHPQDGNFVQKFAEITSQEYEVEVVCVAADPGLKSGSTELVIQQESYGRLLLVYYGGGGARVQRIWMRSKAWRQAIDALQGVPDLLHAHVLIDGGIVADRLARKWNIPWVLTEHASRFLQPWPTLRLPELIIARRAARRAAWLMPVSPSLQRGMEKNGLSGKYRTLANIVDETVFQPGSLAQKRPHTFLHVSCFSANKNVEGILLAFKKLADEEEHVRLVLAGHPPDETLLALVDSLHLRPRQISFPGYHPIEEIASLMREADAFVLNSDVETQSVVLLEAIVSGLPCISTRCGGPEDILTTDKLGILIPKREVQQLYWAMKKLFDAGQPDLADRQNRRQLALQRYGLKHTQASLREIYQGLFSTADQ